MTDEQWNTGMELKFHGARRVLRAWEALKESKGAVVFISGNAAIIPKAGAAAVGAINAAIEALEAFWSSVPGVMSGCRQATKGSYSCGGS
jgi:hypothetical protein